MSATQHRHRHRPSRRDAIILCPSYETLFSRPWRRRTWFCLLCHAVPLRSGNACAARHRPSRLLGHVNNALWSHPDRRHCGKQVRSGPVILDRTVIQCPISNGDVASSDGLEILRLKIKKMRCNLILASSSPPERLGGLKRSS